MKTYPAISGETKLTLRVEANSIFQVKAEYTNLNNPESLYQVQIGDGSTVDISPAGVGLSLVNSNLDTTEQAKDALELLENEMESVSFQMGSIGASLSSLELASQHIKEKTIAAESLGQSIASDASIADEIDSAKAGILLEGSRSVLAKTITTTKNIVNLLF